jgi:hypothetical protein
MSVGVDQLAHQRVVDRRSGRRDEEQAAILSELAPCHWLDADRGAIELELDLATASQTDSIS